MGREAEGQFSWGGQEGPGKAVLEGDGLILRGAVRGRIARGDLGSWDVAGDDLTIATPLGPLVMTLGAAEAAAFARALARPVPGLADKLGLQGGVLALGVSDAALAAAVAPHLGAPVRLVVAEVREAAAVQAALAAAGEAGVPLWLATVKGAGSSLPEDAARAMARAAGWVDSKTCRVSDALAAVRYARRR